MDELVNQVSAKTGVDAETVRKVVQSAAEFIKGKLPPQYAGMVDSAMGGQGGGGNPLGNLGGMFGS